MEKRVEEFKNFLDEYAHKKHDKEYQEHLKEDFKIKFKSSLKSLTIGFLASYCILYFSNIAHELGHAIAAKLLNGSPIDIVIGANLDHDFNDLFKLGPIRFKSLNVLNGG